MNREKKCKWYLYTIVLCMVLLLAVFGISYIQLCNTVLNYQKNMIGLLSQVDEINVEKYIHLMFEPVMQEHIDTGIWILKNKGYTEMGIYYIGDTVGLYQYQYIGAVICVLVGILLTMLYKVKKTMCQEIDILKQEIYFLKQAQLKEEYIEEQNKRIQSFIENIAHQIKTPLSRVFTSLDIVESRLEEEVVQKHVEECYQHLESINGLMKRLMNIGRLEAGKVIFQKEKLHVKALLTEVKNRFGTQGKRIEISCEETLEYYGDEKWLQEAFSNILCNALEADTSENLIEVYCLKNDDHIKISIRDHGAGLSEKDIPNIFDRFYLPENVKENHVGIGLNLAKLVIEGHKGLVYVYNHAEGGAVFQVLLPVYDTLKMR